MTPVYSNQLHWKFNDDTFILLNLCFHLNMVRHYLAHHPVEVGVTNISGLRKHVPISPEEDKFYVLGMRVEEERVARADYGFPIIVAEFVVPVDDKQVVTIDGWHRITKALREGVEEIPYVAVDYQEVLDWMRARLARADQDFTNVMRELNRANRRRMARNGG